MLLNELSINEIGIITQIDLKKEEKNRIESMGVVKGAKIKKINNVIFSLNTCTRLTLSLEIQKKIQVQRG